MARGAVTLVYAARLPVLGFYLGRLAAMLALLYLVPLGVALAFDEMAMALRQGAVVVVLLLALLATRRLPRPAGVQRNEAVAVVALAFVIGSLLGAVSLTGAGLPLVDAWFESVSAVTTTGLSTAGSIEGRSPAFLFSRAWMQWYGGLGIAALSVALIMGHQAAARRLVDTTETEDIAETARAQSRHVLTAYLILTISGVLLLTWMLDDPFSATVHMLATVSTGGFSPFDGSLTALPSAGIWLITGYCLLGAWPLLLMFRHPGARRWLLDDVEARLLLPLTAVACAWLAWSLNRHSGLQGWAALEQGVLLAVSAQTTTGFSTWTVGSLDATSKLLLMVSMAVGGCTGSTAGGIKLLRVLILARLLGYFLQRTAMPPHADSRPRLGGRPLEREDVELVILVVTLFAVAALVSWVAFLAYGYEPVDALFEIVSALGTVGLSTGITRPGLETPLKVLLAVNMLLGRLELLALLVILYPRTWFGRRRV